jgi:hypothetical protein
VAPHAVLESVRLFGIVPVVLYRDDLVGSSPAPVCFATNSSRCCGTSGQTGPREKR